MCITIAGAEEVEMGSCRFQAPNAAFATTFNEQSINNIDDNSCDKNDSCIFIYVLHPNKYLLTNIKDDLNKTHAFLNPFKDERAIGIYDIHIPIPIKKNTSNKNTEVDGTIYSSSYGQPITMKCRVCAVNKQTDHTDSTNTSDTSDDEFFNNLGNIADSCRWR